ncbi:MAG: electron transport complex subunit RsxC [Fluviibacter sp.]
MKLFSFKGGVKPDPNKTQSTALPIAQAPLVARYIVPLHQSVGGTPRPIVAVGDHVLKGQRIGDADGWVSAAVHAPTSGTVVAIGPHIIPHPSGLPTDCVVIESDGNDTWIERLPFPVENAAPETVREYLRDMGIVGMGGAVFPSHVKLSVPKGKVIEQLIINGAECEPFITCDDRLMREQAVEVIQGSALFGRLVNAARVLIGVEDNKPEAIAALKAAQQELGASVEVITVPTIYPTGGAKELIRVLTGKEVPGSKRSTDFGVQVFNVATVQSAWRAITLGEPLISRVVTISGAVGESRNWQVPIGMTIADLVALAQPKPEADGVIMGGPMMGFRVTSNAAPVIKATNSLIVHAPGLFPPKPQELPCIRCGSCATACPQELQPFELYWWSRASKFEQLEKYKLFDCIECGCCDYVCPSHIPLVNYFRFSKSEIQAEQREKQTADAARDRFEFREARAEREKQEKAERLAKANAARKAAEAAAAAESAPAENPAEAAPDLSSHPHQASTPIAVDNHPVLDASAKQAAIAAAVERARIKREQHSAKSGSDAS